MTNQCEAVLPNDRSLRHDDGWKCCCLESGHAEPHRTAYSGAAACIESDREHGRVWALEDLAVPPQTAMGLAGWLYYLMQRGHES